MPPFRGFPSPALTGWMAALTLVLALASPVLAADEAPQGPAVTVDSARMAPIERRVPLSGSLIARQEVVIHPKVAGYAVTALQADVGDQVAAGQVLATLQTDTLAALLAQADAEHERAEAGVKQADSQIASAEASLTEAALTLERTRRLRASGNASQAVLDQAVATEASARANAASARDGLSVARAALAQADAARVIARLNLDYAQITAPVAGTVAQRSARLGELSGSAAEPMFTLIAQGEIELAAEIIETAVPGLVAASPVTLEVSGIGAVAGRIRLLPAEVDPVTRLATLRIALEPDPRLRVGLFASGWVTLDRRQALSVPMTAVLATEDGDQVQVVRDGIIETRPVNAGLIWQGQREIVSGLQEGETVLTRAGAFFRTGDHVRPVATSADAPPDGAGAGTSAGSPPPSRAADDAAAGAQP